MSAAGYRHPTICLALISRHLPRAASRLLDAGAGTGLIGEWLGIMGYPHVEALDISEGMLAQAAKKGAYAALHRLALGRPLPFADGHFAGIVSAGVFTQPAPEGSTLIRCRPGGRSCYGEEYALGRWLQRIAELAAQGQVAIAEKPRPMCRCREADRASRGLVLRRG